jgi:hypothetical protein
MAASAESLGLAAINGGMTGSLIDQEASAFGKALLSTELGQTIAESLGLTNEANCHP